MVEKVQNLVISSLPFARLHPRPILPQRTQRRATMANDELTGGSGAGALREDMISNAKASRAAMLSK